LNLVLKIALVDDLGESKGRGRYILKIAATDDFGE